MAQKSQKNHFNYKRSKSTMSCSFVANKITCIFKLFILITKQELPKKKSECVSGGG